MFSQVSNSGGNKTVAAAKFLNAVGETTPKSVKIQISTDDWLLDYYPKKSEKAKSALLPITKNFDLLFNFSNRETLLSKL